MRIVCLGDSLTWGSYGGNYVDELARLLPEHTFINGGVGGDTVQNLLRRLDGDVIAHSPGSAIIMVGGNDAIAAAYPATRQYYLHVKRLDGGYLTPDAFEQTYHELLSRLQLASILPYVVLQPSEYSRSLSEMLAIMNTRARRAADRLRVPVLDLTVQLGIGDVPERPPLTPESIYSIGPRVRARWNEYEAERKRSGHTFTFDGIHATPEGAHRIAQLIAAFIQS